MGVWCGEGVRVGEVDVEYWVKYWSAGNVLGQYGNEFWVRTNSGEP